MLASNSAAKERILAMGNWGSGKTHSWATIAKWYRSTGTPGTFYVIDTDNTTLRTLEAYDDWEQNVVVEEALDWVELAAATTKFLEGAEPDDWLIIDSIDKPWSYVQDYYIAEMFGTDSADFFFQARLAGNKGSPLADGHGTNWQVINRLYQRWIMPIIRFQGHVYAATPAQAVTEPDNSGKGGDSREIRETFGRMGVRPSGQKGLAFQMHTVLLMQSRGKDEWTLTSAKDRSRDLLVGQPMHDFCLNYLIGVGKWTM